MNNALPGQVSTALTAYAVRLAVHQLVVGLFVARDVDQLADLVGETIDPTTTEYLVLGQGGIHGDGSSASKWSSAELAYPGQEFFEPAQDVHPLDGAVLGESWWRAIDRGTWHPLDWEQQVVVESATEQRTRRKG